MEHVNTHFLRPRGAWTRVLLVLSVSVAAALVAFSGLASATSRTTVSVASPAATPAFDKKLLNYDPRLFALLPPRIQKSKQVVFAAVWETPPIIAVNPKDTRVPVGLTPDLAAVVSRILGVKAVWKNLQFPAQLPGLASGNADVLWGQITDTKEREQSIVDLISWAQSPYGMLLAAGNPHKVTSLANACGLRIAVPTGSTQERIVAGNNIAFCSGPGKTPMKTVALAGAQPAVVAIKAGTADAWLDTSPSIEAIVKAAPNDYTSIIIPNGQIVRYSSNISGVAISKLQPGLTTAIHRALRRIAAPGGPYPNLMKKWGVTSGILQPKHIKINIFTGLRAGKLAAPAGG